MLGKRSAGNLHATFDAAGGGNMMAKPMRHCSTLHGKFYKTKLRGFMHIVNIKLASWARRKYKKLKASEMKAIRWLCGVCNRQPKLFAHWSLLGSKPTVG